MEIQEKCNEGDKTCLPCSGDACNTATSPPSDYKCIQCTQSDAKCIEGLLEAEDCETPGDKMCYKRVDSEGKVDRGCFSSLKPEHQNVCKDEKDKTCQICDSGETCNGGVFPEDRLKCVKCPNEKDCKGNGQVQGYCTLYREHDR